MLCTCGGRNKFTFSHELGGRCREESQLGATEWYYCPYNLLNMFRALISPSSVARDSACVIGAYGV